MNNLQYIKTKNRREKKYAQKINERMNKHQTNNNNNNVLNFSFIFISASCVVWILFPFIFYFILKVCVLVSCVFSSVRCSSFHYIFHAFISYLLNARSHFDCAVQMFSLLSSVSFLVSFEWDMQERKKKTNDSSNE